LFYIFFLEVGNQTFRQVVAANVRRYLTAKTRTDKGLVIRSIVDEVRGISGRFIRLDHRSGFWVEVDDGTAREKVGATIRSIIRKAGGEDALLSQLACLDNHDDADNSPSGPGESLMEWMQPSVAAFVQPKDDNLSGFDVESRTTDDTEQELKRRSWLKTTGLDDSPSSSGKPLVDWVSPSIAAGSLKESGGGRSSSLVVESSVTGLNVPETKQSTESKTSGLYFSESELQWLTATADEKVGATSSKEYERKESPPIENAASKSESSAYKELSSDDS
jgi:hypothetical protein